MISNELKSKEAAVLVNVFCQMVIILLCLGCYMHSLDGDFVFDDTVAIVKNSDVFTQKTNLTSIFRNDFWGEPLTGSQSHKSFRPLTTLMFHLEHKFGFGPKQMKITNLILHCINTLLVWHVIRSFKLNNIQNNKIATITAALFAVHPIHTEPVCGIVGRSDLMFCLMYLIALLVIVSRNQWDKFSDITVISLTTIGMFFKETTITIPLACIFVEYMRKSHYLKDLKLQMDFILSFRCIGHACLTLLLILLRLWLQNFESPSFKPLDNPIAFSEDSLVRILSQNFLYFINLWILLCPNWLCFDWALGCIELVQSIWDLRLQMVIAMYSIIFIAILNIKYNFVQILSIGLLIIPFIPALGIITVGFVIAERVLYVPSIGFCYLVSYSFVIIYGRTKWKWISHLLKWLLMLLFVCLMLRTRERAKDWQTEETLFNSALKVCPKNAKVHYNIARLSSDNGEIEKAIYHYKIAIDLHPKYESALVNLGNIYREKGDLLTAEKYITSALSVLNEFPAAWMNLGIVQSALKKYDDALRSYNNALKYRKNYAVCYYNMGNLFLDQKLYSEAMRHWQKSITLNPFQPKAWTNVLTMLDNRGLHDDVIRLSAKGLILLPNDPAIMFIRANVFGKQKRYVEAEKMYKQIIEMQPFNVLYHTNLGILYHRWGKLNDAINSYQNALKISPYNAITAKESLAKLLKRT